MSITQSEYNAEVESLVDQAIADAIEHGDCENTDDVRDYINDSWLHETIDSHQWVIYYHHAENVARDLTSSPDAWQDCYTNEDVGRIVAEKGIDHWFCVAAYFGMCSDFWDAYDDDKAEKMLEASNAVT